MKRIRFDGPICLDRPNMPDMYTVTDASSPYFKMTNCFDTMLERGFTVSELQEAKSLKGDK